eukprot:6191016-Pleurochrysis_carterae.AAC.3
MIAAVGAKWASYVNLCIEVSPRVPPARSRAAASARTQQPGPAGNRGPGQSISTSQNRMRCSEACVLDATAASSQVNMQHSHSQCITQLYHRGFAVRRYRCLVSSQYATLPLAAQ